MNTFKMHGGPPGLHVVLPFPQHYDCYCAAHVVLYDLNHSINGECPPVFPFPSLPRFFFCPFPVPSSLAGDVGFDPLGLAADESDRRWFVQAELVHSRWAMLGVAGMLATDVSVVEA